MKKESFFRKYRLTSIFLILILLTTACQPASSNDSEQNLAPQMRDRKISESFCRLLELRHISRKKIDQTISQQGFDKYLETIDPLKLYFTKGDVEEFQGLYRDKMAEMAKKGDLSAAFAIYNRYLKRLDERCALVQMLLDSPLDFTIDEEISIDKDDLDYPKDDAEIYDRWRKRIKLDILSLEASDKDKEKEKLEAEKNPEAAKKTFDPYENEDPIAKLHRRYNSLQKRMRQTTNDNVLEDYLSAIANAYDPHSLYWSPKSWENFMIQMQLSLEGIGATLQGVDGYTVVKRLVKGGAADKQGELQAEDRIIGVGQGNDGPIEDVVDMKLDDVVQKIRGKQGTTVRLEVLPGDGSAKKIVKIVREKVELEDSAAQAKIFESGKPIVLKKDEAATDETSSETAAATKPSLFETTLKPDGKPYKIGVVDLPSFYLDMKAVNSGKAGRSTVRDVNKILNDFNRENVDVCVLDLRLNGGGSLPEAVELTGLFIETGSVVQVKPVGMGASSGARSLDDPNPGVSWAKPLVVLTSKFSASASEIFAGAIKDYKRGIVIGDSTTHGKGSVQSTTELAEFLFSPLLSEKANYGTLKVTIQGFYHPSGESPQLQGVKADVVLPSLTDHLEDICESDLDNPLQLTKIAPAKYPVFDYVTPEIVSSLSEKSSRRVAESPEFQKLQEKINWFEESKAKKTTSLNREKYFAEREKLNTEKEELNQFEKMLDSDSEIEIDYYLREVMNVTIDYLHALTKANGESASL